MSKTVPSGRTVIGEGPGCLPGIHARPSNVAAVQSEGNADDTADGVMVRWLSTGSRRRRRAAIGAGLLKHNDTFSAHDAKV